ncbi:NAD(P)-dependent alcohol dehydrogenase [Sphingobium sp. TKS]|uniref:NAD(P)-dependent alcohol dehydrogenase n=1 Tax=Sphingobium sp. TKS TaxID=1315974 RepID=UPI00076FFF5C|nr:NAD(P)-dependent alcohol dehydrogenase [Sphingobium sp. TKS]AMK25580.1 aryl-alcohol dehydrogenase XylB [Sphingobium sp. TKS]
MKIQAAVVRNPGRFDIAHVDLDAPRADEILVRVVAAGICHTDISVLNGDIPWPRPALLGHEGAGIVMSAGASITDLAPGDQVVMSFASCGTCGRCTDGAIAYCENFATYNFSGRRPDGSPNCHLDGEPVGASFFSQSSFAAYVIARRSNVVKVSSVLPLPMLAPLGCGIQTGAGAVLNRLKPERGSSIAIFGMGAVGLSAVLAARISGCDPIIAVDLHEERLALAREMGATHILRGDSADLAATLRNLSDGGVAYAVEATGVPAVMATVTGCLRKTGEVVLLGVPAAREISFPSGIMRGITIHTCVEGDSDPQEMIPRLIELHKTGDFPFEKMIRFFPFADINEAVGEMKNGNAVKPVLLFEKEM